MKEPLCPKCDYPIDCLETVDDSTDVDTYKILCAGECIRCRTNYQWWEVYNFSHTENLEEIEEVE